MEQRFFDYFRAISDAVMAAFRLPAGRASDTARAVIPSNVILLHRAVDYPAPDLHRYLRRHAD